jgi:hypothetical protein
VSTEEGTQSDESAEQSKNARWSIEERREPDSNVTVEREEHRSKQKRQRALTEEGMQIDKSAEQAENADS